MKLLSLFGLLVIVAHSVSGHGDGAPCSIHDSMRPSSAYHGPDKNDISSAPFEVLVLDSSTKEAAACYKPGVNYIVRVQPKSSSNSFRGFLIQSRDSSDKAVGKFDISGDAASKMRYQCKDKTDSVTHKDSDDKSKIDAVWNSDSEQGVLIFKLSVVHPTKACRLVPYLFDLQIIKVRFKSQALLGYSRSKLRMGTIPFCSTLHIFYVKTEWSPSAISIYSAPNKTLSISTVLI